MTPEFAITTFGLRDDQGRRMRETTVGQVAAGGIAALFIAAGEAGPARFRFTVTGPRGRHAGPDQAPQSYDNAGVPTLLLEHELSPTAVPVAGKYRLALEQVREDGSGRELHSVVFHAR